MTPLRDPEAGRAVLARIHALAAGLGEVRIMEVCGGHTHALHRFGIVGALPANVRMTHGPGCPVCVLPVGRIDDAVALARQGLRLCSFGDALRVPGSTGSLLDARAEGHDVRVVYSPMDALELARQDPSREVVFFAIGFETTAPATALTVKAADVPNFSVFCNHITLPPALDALLALPALRVDAFLGPGHVSTVTGTGMYAAVAASGRPVVVSGFEPLDLLLAIEAVLEQLRAGRAEVRNLYRRVVRPEGNPVALAAMAEVFEAREHFEWRGLGSLPASGLRLRARWAAHDAERRFGLRSAPVADPRGCRCAEVLVGRIEPRDCRLFGSACTPRTPVGACMVSSEGACAAEYAWGRPRDPARGPS